LLLVRDLNNLFCRKTAMTKRGYAKSTSKISNHQIEIVFFGIKKWEKKKRDFKKSKVCPASAY
jgi:hypothetical protein